MYDILRQEWLEELPNRTVDTYQTLSREIVNVIINRINYIGTLSRTDTIRLTNAIRYYGADLKEIEKIIAKRTGQSEQEIDEIFQEVANKSDEFAEQFYKYRNMTPLNALEDSFLKEQVYFIRESTKETGRNLSRTLAFKGFDGKFHNLRETYIQTIDRAIYEVQSGTVDYKTAMRKSIMNLSDGIEYVKWDTPIGINPDGSIKYYHRRLDSQIRQNLLDGVRQANQRIMDYHGKQYNADGIELSAHAISAPDHAPVQGRQFSNEEFDKMQTGQDMRDYKGNRFEGFDRAIGTLNCKHFAFPIVLGVSQPVYDDKTLNEYKTNSTEKYPLKMKQRQFERELRTMKQQRMALSKAGEDKEARELQIKINAKQKAYRKFSIENNLDYERDRASVPNYRPIKTK
jgi:hypothetical protein